MTGIRRRKTLARAAPLIWTTFLLLPENVHEIHQAAMMARESGADSISFRPVYHELTTPFTPAARRVMKEQLQLAKQLHDPPSFSVFIPKRDIESVWRLAPTSYFQACLSSRLRTVIEASNGGLLIKICGLHRGSQGQMLAVLHDVSEFSHIWRSPLVTQKLQECPMTCVNCIDVSMNVTLNQVWRILVTNPDAVFHKALFSGYHT
jgi:hypothetical protein